MAGDIQQDIEDEFSDRNIGINVAVLRGETTQKALASGMQELGVKWTQTTVWEIESGKRSLKAREAKALARVLEVPVEYVFGEPRTTRYRRYLQDAMQDVSEAEHDACQALEDYGLVRMRAINYLAEAEEEMGDVASWQDVGLREYAHWLRKITSRTLSQALQERAEVMADVKNRFGEDRTARFFVGGHEVVHEGSVSDGEHSEEA